MKSLIAMLCVLSAPTFSQGFAIEVGSSAEIVFPHDPIMNTTERFTVEWWMSVSPTATGRVDPFYRYSPSAEHKHIVLTTDGRVRFIYAGSPWLTGFETGTLLATPPGSFPLDDAWHHVAFVRHADGTYAVFVDGKSKVAGGPGPCWLTCNIINANTTTQLLSASPEASGWRFRELRVSSVDRYQQDFTPESQLTSDADTAMLVPFDEGAGAMVYDHGPMSQVGSLSGQHQWVPLPVCQAGQADVAAGAPFDHVGSSLAASGSFVFVGISDVDGPGFESGAVSVLMRAGDGWNELPQLTASDETAGALFGHSVALDGDVALVGARGASAETGATYVFRRQPAGAWTEEAKLKASDGLAGDWFGSHVAVVGDVAAVAALHADAPGLESGAVYVFRNGGSGWAQEQKLVGLDTVAGDQFGKGLAISDERILVGAYGDDDAGQDSGSAYVFRYEGGSWNQEAKLAASDAAANALFGNEVALDDDVAVIAARSAGGVGAVYVFRRSGLVWTQEQKLTASAPSPGAEFGRAVDVTDSRILVGALMDDSAALDGGAAYLFDFDGAAWSETAKYTLPTAAPKDHLGSAVALNESGSYAMVGAEWADDPALDSGELWAFPLPGACKPQIASTTATSAQHPKAVMASGFFLGQTQSVLVDDSPASLISASPFSVTYQPQPGAPGYVALKAIGPDGKAEAVQQMLPSLESSTTGIGGAVNVLLDNGDVGLYVLAFAAGALPAPLPISSPPTWYGILLDVTGPVFSIGSGAFAAGDPVALSYPIPAVPAWAGISLYFQAWCQQGSIGPGVTYSFTNAGKVTL